MKQNMNGEVISDQDMQVCQAKITISTISLRPTFRCSPGHLHLLSVALSLIFRCSQDPLSVALHVPLLEVGGEAMQVLVVGQHGVGLGAEAVAVPEKKKKILESFN